MRVLLDHNLPFKLRSELGKLCEHELLTASYMGWRELKNGELLRTAEEDRFEVFVTGDRSIVHEQNIAARRLAVVVLSVNNWPIIKNYVPAILAAIDNAIPGSCRTVDCGLFSRKKRTNSSLSDSDPSGVS